MSDKILILPISSETFDVENYTSKDSNLINNFEVDTNFTSSTDYIESYIFDGNRNLIYPSQTEELITFNIIC